MQRMIKSIFVLFLLGFFTQAQAAENCNGWGTEEYFKTATLEGVTACLDAGVDPNAWQKGDRTPLHNAVANSENLDVIKALINAGADPMARSKEGWTPLHNAVRYNENPDVIKFLIDAGADPTARNGGWTPLHSAAGNNENPDVIKVLLDAGADPNAIDVMDGNRWTPLHCAAASNENPDVIVVLIRAGADINAQLDEHGNTPLVMAKNNNKNKAVIAVLRDGGARESQEEGGFLKTAAALLGGAAIMYAGKDAEDQEAVARAVREYMKGVINEQPGGNINPVGTSSQSQRGQAQGQDQLQQALLNLEKICGEKYQGNFSVDDHARFFCLAAFNDYCALKRAKSDEAISKLRASLQQNCAALKKDGLESKCPYCK